MLAVLMFTDTVSLVALFLEELGYLDKLYKRVFY